MADVDDLDMGELILPKPRKEGEVVCSDPPLLPWFVPKENRTTCMRAQQAQPMDLDAKDTDDEDEDDEDEDTDSDEDEEVVDTDEGEDEDEEDTDSDEDEDDDESGDDDDDDESGDEKQGPVRRNESSVVDGVKLRTGTKPEWEVRADGKFGTNVTYVHHCKTKKRWRAEKVNEAGKLVRIGGYKTWEEAVEARRGVVDGVRGPGVLAVRDNGTVEVTKCSHCCRPFPLGHFAPVPCLHNLQKLPRFEAATADLADPAKCDAAWTALSVIPTKKKDCKALRTAWCSSCREILHKSETEGKGPMAACYRMKLKIRADMASRGCQHPKCTETRPECLEGDHEDRLGKLCAQYTCTSYRYFAGKYGENGPVEMWKCYEGTRPLCKNHHMMEDSHEAARGVDSRTIVDKKAKRERKNSEANGAYNDSRKCGKTCKYCPMVFTMDNARMGAWVHPKDGTGKTTRVATLVNSNLPLKTMKPRIDRVIDVECHGEIACHNCHWAEDTFPMFTRQMDRYRALVAKIHRWIR